MYKNMILSRIINGTPLPLQTPLLPTEVGKFVIESGLEDIVRSLPDLLKNNGSIVVAGRDKRLITMPMSKDTNRSIVEAHVNANGLVHKARKVTENKTVVTSSNLPDDIKPSAGYGIKWTDFTNVLLNTDALTLLGFFRLEHVKSVVLETTDGKRTINPYGIPGVIDLSIAVSEKQLKSVTFHSGIALTIKVEPNPVTDDIIVTHGGLRAGLMQG